MPVNPVFPVKNAYGVYDNGVLDLSKVKSAETLLGELDLATQAKGFNLTTEQRETALKNFTDNPTYSVSKYGIGVFGALEAGTLTDYVQINARKNGSLELRSQRTHGSTLGGTSKNDSFYGNANDHDAFFAGAGNDVIRGYGGNDDLAGNDGNDRIFGGKGDDNLQGGRGHDTLIGEAGKDFFQAGDYSPGEFENGSSQDYIIDFQVKDDVLRLEYIDFGADGSNVEYNSQNGWVTVDGINEYNIGAGQEGFSEANWQF
jgi:Ca2+-binding RTX toxin-like protein